MKKVLRVLVAICTTAVFASFPFDAKAQTKKVSVQLAWVVGGLHAGFFVAKEKKFYSSKGLDVNINRGFGSGDTAHERRADVSRPPPERRGGRPRCAADVPDH